MATYKGQLETKTGENTSDILYPKTSADQVDGLSAELQDIREVAEGKASTFVCSDVNNPILNSTDDYIVGTTLITTEGDIISLSDLKVGDNVYVTETDVPDRWVAGFTSLGAGYTQCEWISYNSNVDNTQTILRFGKLKDYDKIELSFSTTNTSGFDAYIGENPSGVIFISSYNATKTASQCFLSASLTLSSITPDLLMSQVCDGTKRTLTFAYTTNSSNDATIGGYSVTYYSRDKKIYGIKCYKNNMIVKNLVPAYRTSDVSIGMYDIENDEFIESSGSIPFNKGDDVQEYTKFSLSKLETVKPPVQDVKVNNVSVVNNSIANIELAAVASSGSYDDLFNKPTIPTVNDATLTINQNGVSKGTFTANAGTDVTIDLIDTTYTSKTATSGGNELSLVTTGEKYTWNNKSNFSGSYDDLSNKPTIPTVNNATLTVTQNGTSKGTFTANASSDVTIEVSDTTYSSQAAAQEGTTESLVTTGEKYIWNSKSDFSGSYNDLSNKPTNLVITDTDQTITGTKTFEQTGSFATENGVTATASGIALVLKGDNLKLGTNPSSNHFNSINFTDFNNATVTKFSAIQTSDGWSGFLAGAGSDPTNPQNNLLMIANGNSKLMLIPPTAGHTSSAVRRDFFNNNAVIDVIYDTTTTTLQKKVNKTTTGVLTFDTTPTNGSTNGITSGGVYSAVEDVREVAEGKTATYVVDDTVDTAFNSQADTITLTSSITDINKGTIALDNLAIGDNIYVTQLEVPDRWVSTINTQSDVVTSVILSKLETAKVPVNDVQVGGTSVVSNGVASITLPVVNNATLTLIQNGVTKGTFTANASSDNTVNLDDTTYQNLSAVSGGDDVSLVTTGEKYIWNNKSDFSGAYDDLTGKPNLSNYVPTSRTINNKALSSNITLGVSDVGALPSFTINLSHAVSGQPVLVKFITVDYSSYSTYSNTCFKLSAMSCHPNGKSYQFLEDMFISVSTDNTVVCQVYKYIQTPITYDGKTMGFGDVFYVIDTANKICEFYMLCGQFSSTQYTPLIKIGSTITTGVTQHSGTATYYSSGEKHYATGNSTIYARLSDIDEMLKTISGYSASATQTLKNINGTFQWVDDT